MMDDHVMIVLRPASPADAEFVFRLAEAGLRHYAEQTWGKWDDAGTRASFVPATHRIIQYGGQDVGCIALVESPDELELNRLFILPEFQNRGIGARLMGEVIAGARARRKPIRLRVLAVNPARRFWERLGFRVTRSTPERHYMEWSEREQQQ
jgi:GNAT superfamily N-acetyltransferase